MKDDRQYICKKFKPGLISEPSHKSYICSCCEKEVDKYEVLNHYIIREKSKDDFSDILTHHTFRLCDGCIVLLRASNDVFHRTILRRLPFILYGDEVQILEKMLNTNLRNRKVDKKRCVNRDGRGKRKQF